MDIGWRKRDTLKRTFAWIWPISFGSILFGAYIKINSYEEMI